MSYREHKSEESTEDYLKAILILSKEQHSVRSVDIARQLGFSKPSVSAAMKNLNQQQLIAISAKGLISLTASGLERAEAIYEKHTFLSDWLTSIGVPPEIALKDACRLEHNLSPESFFAMKASVSGNVCRQTHDKKSAGDDPG